MSSSGSGIPNIKYAEPGRKLKQTEIDFMKLIEKQNIERVEKLRRLKRNNKITAFTIGASVFGIYLYSMLAVKQEKFLDDFDEPLKIDKN
jgi:hypothetical protein